MKTKQKQKKKLLSVYTVDLLHECQDIMVKKITDIKVGPKETRKWTNKLIALKEFLAQLT